MCCKYDCVLVSTVAWLQDSLDTQIHECSSPLCNWFGTLGPMYLQNLHPWIQRADCVYIHFLLLLLWCLLQKYSLKLGIRTCHSFCLWFLDFVSMLRIKITTNFIGHQSISCAHSHWILTTLWIDVLTSFHRWWVGNFS